MSTLGVFCGGVDRLPFGGVLSPYEAQSLLEQTMHPDAFNGCSCAFLKQYGTWYEAFQMVKRRFEFYVIEALEYPDLFDEIGTHDRDLRIIFAIHRCIVKAKEIKEKMKALPKEFLDESLRKAECRLQGIEPIEVKPKDFSPSTCEMTGVCTCKDRGAVPPYMHGCLGDTTLLLPYEEEPCGTVVRDSRIIVTNR
ncbi:MAG: hypothetical protein WCJ25_02540 [Candidatus Moraniibacteriota bacterium]